MPARSRAEINRECVTSRTAAAQQRVVTAVPPIIIVLLLAIIVLLLPGVGNPGTEHPLKRLQPDKSG